MEAVTPLRSYRLESGSLRPMWISSVQIKYYDLIVNGKKIHEFETIPQYLKELALGFLYSNGYVEDPEGIESIQVEDGEIRVEVSPDFDFKMQFLKEKDAQPLELIDIEPVGSPFRVSEDKILEKVGMALNYSTDVPFFFISDINGYFFFAEDLHPENAFYKVVGRALFDHFDLRSSFVFSSYYLFPEDVVRSAYVGIPVIGSTKGTTDLATTVAQSLGITILTVGLDGIHIFSHPSRIQ